MMPHSTKRHELSISINTWLLGIGAAITGFNVFFGDSLSKHEASFIHSSLSVGECIQLSGWAIFFAAFFYSLVIIKPDLLRRQREFQLLKVKEEVADNSKFRDQKTGLYSREYFERVLSAFLTEYKALDKKLYVFSLQLNCGLQLTDRALDGVVQAVLPIIEGRNDSDFLAKIDGMTLAMVVPYMSKAEAVALKDQLELEINRAGKLPMTAWCEVSFASYPQEAKGISDMIEAIYRTLGIGNHSEVYNARAPQPQFI